MSVRYVIHSTFLTDSGKSLMFCSFSNIFSQRYIVRLFRFAIISIHIFFIETEFKVKVEILNFVGKMYFASVLFVSMAFGEAQI